MKIQVLFIHGSDSGSILPLTFKQKYLMLHFINEDFKKKCHSRYFMKDSHKNDWLVFIQNYFSLEKIQLDILEKDKKFLFLLEFYIGEEKFQIKYAERFVDE